MTDSKVKIFQRLLQAHDTLYNAVEILEETKTLDPVLVERLCVVLNELDRAEAFLNSAIDTAFWKVAE